MMKKKYGLPKSASYDEVLEKINEDLEKLS